jgi:hypothetical protein
VIGEDANSMDSALRSKRHLSGDGGQAGEVDMKVLHAAAEVFRC